MSSKFWSWKLILWYFSKIFWQKQKCLVEQKHSCLQCPEHHWSTKTCLYNTTAWPYIWFEPQEYSRTWKHASQQYGATMPHHVEIHYCFDLLFKLFSLVQCLPAFWSWKLKVFLGLGYFAREKHCSLPCPEHHWSTKTCLYNTNSWPYIWFEPQEYSSTWKCASQQYGATMPCHVESTPTDYSWVFL